MDPVIKEVCMNYIEVTDDNEESEEVKDKIDWLDILCDKLDDEDALVDNDYLFFVDVLEVIESNLFRTLPPSKLIVENINIGPGFGTFNSEDDPQMKIISSVYSLLFSFIETVKDGSTGEEYFDEDFVKQFFALVKSEDENERSYVAKICKSMYTYFGRLAKLINKLLLNSLLEVIDNKSAVFCHVDHLLEILHFIITNEEDKEEINRQSLLNILISLHRLPYIFHFHQNLFSCSILMLEKYPSDILFFTSAILRIFAKSPTTLKPTDSHTSTKQTLGLIELEFIFDLLLRLIAANDETLKLKKDFEVLFDKLAKPFINFCILNLQSHQIIVVTGTIKLLSCRKYRNYFTGYLLKNREVLRRITQLMNDELHYIYWEEPTLVQQFLFRCYLNQLNNKYLQ